MNWTKVDAFYSGVLFGLGLVLGLCWMLPPHRRCISRTEAVKHGAATWVVAEDGSTTFKWKSDDAAKAGEK